MCECVHMLVYMFVCVFLRTCHGDQWMSLWSCFSLSIVYGFWEPRLSHHHSKETIRKPLSSWESILLEMIIYSNECILTHSLMDFCSCIFKIYSFLMQWILTTVFLPFTPPSWSPAPTTSPLQQIHSCFPSENKEQAFNCRELYI